MRMSARHKLPNLTAVSCSLGGRLICDQVIVASAVVVIVLFQLGVLGCPIMLGVIWWQIFQLAQMPWSTSISFAGGGPFVGCDLEPRPVMGCQADIGETQAGLTTIMTGQRPGSRGRKALNRSSRAPAQGARQSDKVGGCLSVVKVNNSRVTLEPQVQEPCLGVRER